ncbi:MAG: 3-phosphoshikimate 1-carboxyvinyltransferase [Kiritimatiellae bacterium]|nr:3-phosphoshikimate 1-carboxyvinyltransferase [Kiritimatiellia bacterium]
MELKLHTKQKLAGEVSLPGDKSLSHRAALFAALADGVSEIDNFLDAGVTRAMLQALSAFGVQYELNGRHLTVFGHGLDGWQQPQNPVFCGNSATTYRLLAGAVAASGLACTLDGSEGLRARPMERIFQPLRQMGVGIESDNGRAPARFLPRSRECPLRPIHTTLPVASAQVKSCLTIAALYADGESVIDEPGPSRDHTERMLRSMGAQVISCAGNRVQIVGSRAPLHPLRIDLPGDISSAAFLLTAAALVPGSFIRIPSVGVNPTRTGFLDALRSMGGSFSVENEREVCGEPVGDIRLTASPLSATEVSGDLVVRMIDEFPVFAALACGANGVTRVRGAKELRYKESDRIAILCEELKRIGVTVKEFEDGFDLVGGTCRGGEVDAHGDHRIAMSLALLGLISPEPVVVRHAEILNESFPEFLTDLQQIGGEVCLSA